MIHSVMCVDGISWSWSVAVKRQVVLYTVASPSTDPDMHTPTGSTTISQSAHAAPPRTLQSARS